MQIFNIFDRYTAKIVFNSTFIATFLLISISGIIKFIDQLKITNKGNYNIIDAGFYTFLGISKDVQLFFPMAALLGILLYLSILSQYNELIALQVLGFSHTRILVAIIKTLTPMLFINIINSEYVAPWSEYTARNYRSQAIYGGSLLATKHGLWAKDGNDFIYINNIIKDNELKDISIYMFDKQHHLKMIRHAVIAKFDIKKRLWLLSQVRDMKFKNFKQILNLNKQIDLWETRLTPSKLNLVILDPNNFSIRGLFTYIKYLTYSGQDSRHYKLIMWNKIFQPFSIVLMISVIVYFILKRIYNVSSKLWILIGIIFGFFFFIFEEILWSLTLENNISPIVGAILPMVVSVLLNLWLILFY